MALPMTRFRVKKKIVKIIVLLTSCLPVACLSDDLSVGRMLYENHCQVCHESAVHIREKRKTKSIEDIENWVKHSANYQNPTWSESQIAEVVQFLNAKCYNY